MIQDSFPAMGTTITVAVATTSDTDRCRRLFDDVEGRLSRFIPDSELSLLNRDPAPVVEVSATLADVLRAAQDLRHRTNGLVDPGVGAAVVAWGYDRTFAAVTGGTAVPGRLDEPSWEISERVMRRDPGTRIDLGGIAKGWTADLAVDLGLAHLVSAGGDIRSATDEAVVDVLDGAGNLVARVQLGVGALATSSVSKRRWATEAGDANHLIDPRTMAPTVSPVVTASALCATAAESEAAAKATLLLGESGLRWAAGTPWIEASMVLWHDGSVYATSGWELAA